jgi:hypothetical protein
MSSSFKEYVEQKHQRLVEEKSKGLMIKTFQLTCHDEEVWTFYTEKEAEKAKELLEKMLYAKPFGKGDKDSEEISDYENSKAKLVIDITDTIVKTADDLAKIQKEVEGDIEIIKKDAEINESSSTKEYTIIVDHDKRGKKEVKGTLDYLNNYFSYTLLIGNQSKSSINKNPKTIKSFISNLQKSYDEKEAALYDRTSVSLKEEPTEEKSSVTEAVPAVAARADVPVITGQLTADQEKRRDALEKLTQKAKGANEYNIKAGIDTKYVIIDDGKNLPTLKALPTAEYEKIKKQKNLSY